MPDSISWSFNAASSSGAASKASGKATVDATLAATKSFKKNMGAAEVLKFQLETAASVAFLAVTSTVNDGKVKIKADGDEVAITGPLVLHGNALALFADDLSEVSVQNTSTTEAADVSILIGLSLA